MRNHNAFPALTAQIALACCLVTLTYIFTLNDGTPGTYYPQVLLAYAPLLYGINRLFLRHERSLLTVVVLNGALWTALTVSVCVLEWTSGATALITAAAFALCVTVRGACLAVEGIRLRSLILTLDLTSLLLVVFIAYLSACGKSVLWAIPIAAGFAASVLGMIANRMGRPLGGREWGLIGGAFLLITLAVLLLVGVAAAPVGQGLVALWSLLLRAGRLLLKLAGQFLLFLLSLLPDSKYDTPEALFPMPEIVEQETPDPENPVILLILFVLLALLLAAFLVWCLRQLSRLRIGGTRRRVAASRHGRSRPSLWSALKQLFAARLRQLRMLRFLRRHRDQPAGLYFILVRRCRMGPWHKRPGETPREFLTRLQSCAREDPQLEQALRALIPLVDQALYAPSSSPASVPQAGLICRRIGRAVRGQFVRDAVSRLRGGLTRLTGKKRSPAA